MSVRELKSEFKKLTNDTERWKWIIAHKDKVEIYLDNDQTSVYLKTPNENEAEENELELAEFIGNSDGIFSLLAAIGISADPV